MTAPMPMNPHFRHAGRSPSVSRHLSRAGGGSRECGMAHLQPLPQSARPPAHSPWPLCHVPRSTKLLTRCLASSSLITGCKLKHTNTQLCFFTGTRFVSRGTRFVSRRRRRAGGMAVAGMLGEAIKGAVREAWLPPGVAPVQRAVILFTLLVIIVREVAGTLKLARYGAYAYWLYASLKPWRKEQEKEKALGSSKNVVVARNVRYGPAQRNLLDVYVPCKRKFTPPEGKGLKPVVVFVHGGVWASGDKWQFSPLGTFLAEEGVIAVLVQYTLYPEVLAIDQVGEVSAALTWTMDNIVQYGGDPNRVFLMGHSSGAHLSSMVLWERAILRVEKAQRPIPDHLDIRIPRGFLGLAGVYNIGEHFKYEVGRGVGAISCMRPACGWEDQFDSMSPSLLFESLLLQGGAKFVAARETDPPTDQIQIRGLDLVPRCLFLASNHDSVVPPSSSFALNSMLQTLGCESRVVLHEELSHEDFVLWHRGWGSLKTHIGAYLEDLLRFVTVEEYS